MTLESNESHIFEGLTIEQWRFIAARLETSTDKAAAEQVGISRSTVSRWENKAQVDAAVAALARRAADGASSAIEQQAIRAVMTIAKLMESEDEGVKLRAAQDLLDRAIGKATQRQEVTGADGGVIRVTVTGNND